MIATNLIAPHTFIARAIIIRDACLLVNSTQSPSGEPYCALPGGHVDPGENCRFALKRELLEELEAKITVGELALVSELKYLAGKKRNKQRHEIVLFFHAELENELAMNGAQILSPEPRKNFIWLPLTEMYNQNVVPPILREVLGNETTTKYDFRDLTAL